MASHLYIDSTPKEVSSAPGLHLITQSTPNGQATQIFLEELESGYGTPFTTTVIDISTNEQKKEWFLRLNPNGRIPVVVDNTRSPPFPVFETSAQLLYLVEHFDKDHKFSFTDPLEKSEVEQWIFFWHGGGAPYQGNLGYFSRNSPDNDCMCQCFPPLSFPLLLLNVFSFYFISFPNLTYRTRMLTWIPSRHRPFQK